MIHTENQKPTDRADPIPLPKRSQRGLCWLFSRFCRGSSPPGPSELPQQPQSSSEQPQSSSEQPQSSSEVPEGPLSFEYIAAFLEDYRRREALDSFSSSEQPLDSLSSSEQPLDSLSSSEQPQRPQFGSALNPLVRDSLRRQARLDRKPEKMDEKMDDEPE